MAAIQRKKVYGPLNGGLNDKLSPIMIKDDEGAELVNFQVSDRGILEKVKGYQKDHSPFPDDTDSFIRFMLNYKKGTTVDVLLMAARDDANTDANYRVDFKKTIGDGTSSYIGHTAGTNASFTNGSTTVTGVGTSWLSHLKAGDKIKATAHADGVYGTIDTVVSDTSITLSANYTGATVSNVAYIARIIVHKDFGINGVVFNNKAIITNGSEKAMTFDNDTLNLLTSANAPRGNYIETHKSRVFMARTSSNTSRLFWSAVNDEATWDATSIEDVFPNDNGNITSIKSFGDSLIVLKSNGRIYQVLGNFDQDAVGEPDQIRKIDVIENIGIIAERTPVIHNNFLYFMTTTGIYRLDQRMYMEKVSYGADSFVSGLSMTAGSVSDKTYTYDSDSQWNAWTHTGMVSRSNVLAPYFDEATLSDVYAGGGTGVVASTSMDSSNNVHIAYVNTSQNVIYRKWTASTNALEAAVTVYSGGDATACASMCITAGTTVGVAYVGTGGVVFFSENTGSGFGAADTVTLSAKNLYDACYTITTAYPLILTYDPASSLAGVEIYRKNAGAWNGYKAKTNQSWESVPCMNIARHSADTVSIAVSARVTFFTVSTSMHGISASTFNAASPGDNWLQAAVATHHGNDNDRVYVAHTGSASFMARYSEVNRNIKVYQDNATLIRTISNVYNLYGVHVNTAGSVVLNYATNAAGSQTEVMQLTGTAITSSTVGYVDVTTWPNTLFGNGARSNGNIGCVSIPLASANSFLFRRYAFYSQSVAAETSDASLTSWGTYDISQTTNSATVLHEVAVNATSPATSFNTITNGQIVSADATKIFIIARITATLGAFAAPQIDSVIINFSGTGADAKAPTGISFDTELYYALSKTTDAENNHVLVLDTDEKLLKLTYPVSVFARFKNKLYAGKSNKGDLLILKQGYNFGAVATAYTADFQSREDFLDAIELEKDLYKFYVLFEVKSAGTFVFSYRTSSFAASGGSDWTTTTIDQTSKGIAEIHIGKKARSLQFRVQNSNADQQVGVIAVVLVYGILNIR